MTDIHIRKEGKAGRITLTRPEALNALSYDMCLKIDAALIKWADDDEVALILIDAEGDRAFCAGGDIREIYEIGLSGDHTRAQEFWRDEYRMNARLFEFPKPVVSFMQGFTMGGGVGVGCHGSHRIMARSSRMAMPECGIGLVPDVGGSMILAHAPGRLGEYIGMTGARLAPGDAIHAGFADYVIRQAEWDALKADLIRTGDPSHIDEAAIPPIPGNLSAMQPMIDAHFGGGSLGEIVASLRAEDSQFAENTLELLGRNSPLSMACTVEMLHRMAGTRDVRTSLELEYRFVYRALEHSDLVEGIRAAVIDKDRNPNWEYDMENLPQEAVEHMLAPLGDKKLTF
ncbi:enoyl-CoA hydratase/isomerase family protein [Aliiroseovarius sp. S1123]|jgi:enoyl-CoA hydratase/carnithine racemase|uniref:enoyl-CoA hydratase/isomerase family protein n=1 Tax=unclassified Aliiroseovarius TaxID=2623558 RepID=UPI001FF5B77F|nr:enoyl-CoA hydratase/isomerase family protein [Aliiroseovarius sp. S1123]MCK0172397.1 enoyl-CoA hydratase/isomerase family protein [Aliiroseovarius sp. S1123]